MPLIGKRSSRSYVYSYTDDRFTAWRRDERRFDASDIAQNQSYCQIAAHP